MPPNKRRRISSPNDTPHDASNNDDLDTDTKLAILSSLHPSVASDHLLEVLISNDGNLEATITQLTSSPSRKQGSKAQSSISTYLPPSSTNRPITRKPVPKGKTLHLYTPESIAAYAPCTLIPSFLPSPTAEGLLRDLLSEAEKFPKELKFRLFERTVQSPHTSCLYVPDESLLYGAEGGREGGYNGGGDTGWFYNGGRVRGIRVFTELMKEVVPLVEEAVNREMEKYWGLKLGEEESDIDSKAGVGKIRIPLLSPKRWVANAAFVNCYDGPQQSVGYHTDQLTYLGPLTTIASLSLGVAREFRVRRWGGLSEEELRAGKAYHDFYEHPNRVGEIKDDAADVEEVESEKEAEGPIGIHLAHNSLLVMHGGMQEGWKHSVHPANSIDHHPIAGNKRINITFRCYRSNLSPDKTPRCRCNVPTVLRVVMDRNSPNCGRYYWTCQGGYAASEDEEEGKVKEKQKAAGGKAGTGKKDGCGYFQWGRFDIDGEPVWEGD